MEGRVFAGRYRLVEMLGQGGMGSVWRARHLELDTEVAIKLMDPSLTTHGEGLARFRREAQSAASLKSPNVVQVFDYGVDGDTPYIAMELLQGESLAKRLERSGRLSISATALILSQVARAVGKAHDAGIVHRDLKPENIFLVLDEDVEIAKVLDFGIAKRTGPGSSMTGVVQTQTGAMLGTPYYMSPEQAAGKKDVDHRTDIWSFGVIACECVTGRRLFDAESLGGLVLAICTEPVPLPSQLAPVPPGFDPWFLQCVSRERQSRFQTIREAASTLEAIGRMTTDGVVPRSFASASQQAVPTAAAPAPWQSAPGMLSGSQAGPTSVTLSNVSNSNRTRLFGLGAALGVVVIGSGLFFWSTRSAMLTTTSTGSALPSPEHAVRAPQPSAAALLTVVPSAIATPTPTPSVSPAPQTAISASSLTAAHSAATPGQPRLRLPTVQDPSGSNAPSIPSSVPAIPSPAPTTPASVPTIPSPAPPHPTQRSNAVDLAF